MGALQYLTDPMYATDSAVKAFISKGAKTHDDIRAATKTQIARCELAYESLEEHMRTSPDDQGPKSSLGYHDDMFGYAKESQSWSNGPWYDRSIKIQEDAENQWIEMQAIRLVRQSESAELSSGIPKFKSFEDAKEARKI